MAAPETFPVKFTLCPLFLGCGLRNINTNIMNMIIEDMELSKKGVLRDHIGNTFSGNLKGHIFPHTTYLDDLTLYSKYLLVDASPIRFTRLYEPKLFIQLL